MKQLTFFPLDSEKHVKIQFTDGDGFLHFFNNYAEEKANEKLVYLFTYEDCQKEGSQEIFVTDNILQLADIVSTFEFAFWIKEKTHLHEYRSFEDAYAVALNMREVNELCYG